MNKKFETEVLKLRGDLRAVENYFYKPPITHVMCGFACERPPSGAYIWKYALPLYDRLEFLHLGLADRLPKPHDFMIVRRGDEHQLAREFVERINLYCKDLSKLSELSRFLLYVESRG